MTQEAATTAPEDRAALPQSVPRVSVVICCYRDDRFELLQAAIGSAQRQTLPPHEVIVVVDHNDRLEQRVRAVCTDIIVLPNTEDKGPSGARNVGVKAATGEIVAFLDDDAIAEPDWLLRLVEPYREPTVLGVGGGAVPRWEGDAPNWLPAEFYWVIGCTWRGLPVVPSNTRNFIGANMSFRRSAYLDVGGLSSDFFVRDRAINNEETDLCIRLTQRRPHGKLMFLPDVVVGHYVPNERTSVRYFLRRCWLEGRAKRITTSRVGASAGLSRERAHVSRVIPTAMLSALRDAVGGKPSALARLLALLVGTLVTIVAFLLPTSAASSQ